MLLTPSRRLLIVGLCCAAVAWTAGPAGRFAVVLTLLLFGPGYLIETLLRPAKTPTTFQRPALWLGLSLSVVALLYQWATFVGLALTLPILSVLAVGCGLGVAWRAWHDGGAAAPALAAEPPLAVPSPRRSVVSGLGLLAIFVLTLWTRFVEIQNLVLPAWVDSVHHTLMVRVAAESGKVPYSLRPYLPVDDMPYHWGYHVFTAAVLQLSNITLPQVVFWSGQVLNALHVLTCAALATYLWRRPLAGVVAGLVVGLLSIMPAYYVSWGRYTQLTGLLILPPLMIAWHAGLRQASRRWFVIASVLLAGLSVTHFRILVFALAFLAVASVVWALSHPWSLLRRRLMYAIGIAVTSLLLAGPWLGLLTMRALRPVIESPQELVSGGSYTALNERLLWSGHNYWLVALALLAALWCVWQRTRATIDIVG
ncbi:MAG: hypothetical protein MI924_26290, partial [Chloroflexales bacterium]|nr:hypothetical protein [Chloroflexales bacterium]